MYQSCSLPPSAALWVHDYLEYWRLARFFSLLYSYASLFNCFFIMYDPLWENGSPRVPGPVKAIVANLECLGHGPFLR